MAIMKSAIDMDKIKSKDYKLPLVISIVLYTGSEKWNAAEYLQKSQETLRNMKEDVGRYNLIDVNDFTENELLADNTFITKMMLIEKSKNTEEIVKTLEKIIERTKDEDKDVLIRIIKIILKEKLNDGEIERLISKIKKGEKEMLAVVDMIRKENQMYIDIGIEKGKNEGKIEGIKEKSIEITKKLLNKRTSKKEIAEITGLDEKEIEEIEKTVTK